MTINDDLTLSEHSSTGAVVDDLAAKLVVFLETNVAPEGLFTDDVFCDFTMPLWRLQAQGREDAVMLRTSGHPGGGRVPRCRLDVTSTGFVLEVEEEWEADGQSWYCRELIRCDVAEHGGISAISVYCTGDWDEQQVARHRRTVSLIRP
jgi:hypothetical protein